jgi:hypothetical protein
MDCNICFRVGFAVGCVYWLHTTMPNGAWVWCLLTADVNVRTLRRARCGAPPPGREFRNRWFVVQKWVHAWISKWVARELSGGRISKL